MKLTITEVNPVWSHISDKNILYGLLYYKIKFKRVNKRGWKELKEIKKELYTSKGYFYTGFIPKVEKYLISKGIDYSIDRKPFEDFHFKLNKEIGGKVFRDYQIEIINSVNLKRRGIWQAPTGAGKTIMAAGIISSFPKCKTLFLVHTKSLLEQTVKVFNDLLDFKIGKVGDGICDIQSVTVATRQSAVSQYQQLLSYFWNIIIVDEAHHVNTVGGQYNKLLEIIKAPIRIGLTATPLKGERGMLCEGLLGPIVELIGEKKLQEKEILAKPIVKIYKVPDSKVITKWDSWRVAYEKGIILNRTRNLLIVEKAVEFVKKNKTLLIMVKNLEHGEILNKIFDRKYSDLVVFIQGNTPNKIREQEKKDIEEGKRKIVIATSIWYEGVDIPNLSGIMIASGGKEEQLVLQRPGRAMRATENKKEFYLFDFYTPPNFYLVSHFCERMWLYMRKGWIK